MEAKGQSRTYVAFALLCTLAVCCSVMYITSDGDQELMLSSGDEELVKEMRLDEGPFKGDKPPDSFESTDVGKMGIILTETPDGKDRLLNYLEKVERMIATEVAGRKTDIQNIRSHMAKNMEFNAKARKAMRTNIMAKMAANAKIAKDALNKSMRQTQEKFAKNAQAANKRHKADIKQFKATRLLMRQNKKAAQEALRVATENQARALSALASSTDAHISQTNKHIAQNAMNIQEAAKTAQTHLDDAMNKFNDKMAKVGADAKAGRSKLMAQAATQDKKFRTWANNKVREEMVNVAAKFAKVRKTMAEDRHHADHALQTMSTKMTANLNAKAALQDDRFSKTVKNIAKAREDADKQLTDAQTAFNVQMVELASTAKKQTYELKQSQKKLAGTVEHDKLAQATVNKNVNAELLRMTKLGNSRYAEHLAKDKELKDLLDKNKDATAKAMTDMASNFNSKMNDIRETSKKDRAAATANLKKATDELHATMAKNQLAQDAKNTEMADASTAAGKDAADALDAAKLDFARNLATLHETATTSAKNQQEKINALTGVVEEDALKNKEGRDQISAMQKANKAEIEHAITNAINLGEQRATQIEEKMKSVNDKTKAAMMGKVETQIATLRDETQKSLFKLSLDSKAARGLMKKQVLASLKEATEQADQDLKAVVTWATGQFVALDATLADNAAASLKEREAIKKNVADNKALAQEKISAAMDAQAKATFAFATETKDSLSKTNANLEAQAKIMKENAAEVKTTMDKNAGILTDRLAKAKDAAQTMLAAKGEAASERYQKAIKAVEDGVAAGKKKSEDRFGDVYVKMAENADAAKASLGDNVAKLNAAMAQEAMLQNKQFTTNLKQVAAMKTKARNDVAAAKMAMNLGIAEVTAEIKQSETRVQGEIAVVTGQLLSNEAAQARTNKKVKEALENIISVSNSNLVESNDFHKELRVKAQTFKNIAAEELKAVADKATLEISLTRGKMAEDRQAAAIRLTQASKELGTALMEQSTAASARQAGAEVAQAAAVAASANKLKNVKTQFKTRTAAITNLITANNHKQEKRLAKATGFHMDVTKAAQEDRTLMRSELKTLGADLNKAISRAIQLGEAKMTKVQQEALRKTDSMKRAMLSTIAEQVENMADTVFATVQNDRHKIGDNYLSLKAYAVAAKSSVENYVAKGKGRNLACLGDLLTSISDLSDIEVGKTDGIGAGADSIPAIFSGKKVKVKNPLNKINFMVNEYVGVMKQLHNRWPLGIGRYLLDRVEMHMQDKGVLEVDNIDGKAGNYVFINGHSVGLSSKLQDFEQLAVRMDKYSAVLKKLSTKKVKTTGETNPKKILVTPVQVPGPEWQGD